MEAMEVGTDHQSSMHCRAPELVDLGREGGNLRTKEHKTQPCRRRLPTQSARNKLHPIPSHPIQFFRLLRRPSLFFSLSHLFLIQPCVRLSLVDCTAIYNSPFISSIDSHGYD